MCVRSTAISADGWWISAFSHCTKESSQYIREMPGFPVGAIWRQILSLIYHSNASRALMSVEKTLGFAPFNKWIKAAWSMWWHLPKMTRTILGEIVLDKIIVSNKADGPSDTTDEELLQPDNCIFLLRTLIFSIFKYASGNIRSTALSMLKRLWKLSSGTYLKSSAWGRFSECLTWYKMFTLHVSGQIKL